MEEKSPNFKQEPTMECCYCKEIEFEHIDTLTGQGKRTLEYKCNDCQQIAYFDEKMEHEKQDQEWWTQQDQDDQWINNQ